MTGLVFYTSESGNTGTFVNRLGLPSARIPISPKSTPLVVSSPYILIIPTYASGDGRGAVAKGIIRFLNEESNRRLIRGVIGAGNTNFGEMYCRGAKIIAEKCNVELLYRFELLGTKEDLLNVRNGVKRFWKEKSL